MNTIDAVETLVRQARDISASVPEAEEGSEYDLAALGVTLQATLDAGRCLRAAMLLLPEDHPLYQAIGEQLDKVTDHLGTLIEQMNVLEAKYEMVAAAVIEAKHSTQH